MGLILKTLREPLVKDDRVFCIRCFRELNLGDGSLFFCKECSLADNISPRAKYLYLDKILSHFKTNIRPLDKKLLNKNKKIYKMLLEEAKKEVEDVRTTF